MTMMGWEELVDWITRGLVVTTSIFLALAAVAVLTIAVYLAIHAFRRSLTTKTPPAALSIEELMARIPDVPVVPTAGGGAAAAAADDGERESLCVICVAPFEPAGELACGVLPGCGHVFHKLCVATWLRLNITCPLCRTAFAVTADDDARQANAVSAVENMV